VRGGLWAEKHPPLRALSGLYSDETSKCVRRGGAPRVSFFFIRRPPGGDKRADNSGRATKSEYSTRVGDPAVSILVLPQGVPMKGRQCHELVDNDGITFAGFYPRSQVGRTTAESKTRPCQPPPREQFHHLNAVKLQQREVRDGHYKSNGNFVPLSCAIAIIHQKRSQVNTL